MCAIVDTDVWGQVFGDNPSEAGIFFRAWLNRRGRLAVGGLLYEELSVNQSFKKWAAVAFTFGRGRRIPDDQVNAELTVLRRQGGYGSTDPHILALARVSGARLLFSNDGRLHEDFRNRDIIGDGVRGRVYRTVEPENLLEDSHRRLLNSRDTFCVTYCNRR